MRTGSRTSTLPPRRPAAADASTMLSGAPRAPQRSNAHGLGLLATRSSSFRDGACSAVGATTTTNRAASRAGAALGRTGSAYDGILQIQAERRASAAGDSTAATAARAPALPAPEAAATASAPLGGAVPTAVQVRFADTLERLDRRRAPPFVICQLQLSEFIARGTRRLKCSLHGAWSHALHNSSAGCRVLWNQSAGPLPADAREGTAALSGRAVVGLRIHLRPKTCRQRRPPTRPSAVSTRSLRGSGSSALSSCWANSSCAVSRPHGHAHKSASSVLYVAQV